MNEDSYSGILPSNSDSDFSKKLFLLDGDVYRTPEQRRARIAAVLTGNESNANSRRELVGNSFRELNPGSQNISPEARLHQMIRALTHSNHMEIVEIANTVEVVSDTHGLIGGIIDRLGLDAAVGCARIVDAAAESPEWAAYVAELQQWLQERRDSLVEH